MTNVDHQPPLNTPLLVQAYRDRALKHHPDKGGDAAAFAKLSTAFRVLVDPQQRRAYDLLAGETAFRPGGPRVG